MENKKIYGDDVERVVNKAYKTKQATKMARVEKKRRKLIVNAITFATVGLVFALFGICNWLVGWIAFPLFFGFVVYATFCFGRFFENGKCLGWR